MMQERSEAMTGRDGETEWEMRPGGMLVQKRAQNGDVFAPLLRLRVAFGDLRFQISVNSQATFGEVKKLLAAETRLAPADQRLIYKGRERKNGEFLDTCGVKDRSKVILIEDPASIERRCIEMRRISKIQTVRKAVSEVSTQIHGLAEQVSAIEKSVSSGNKAPEVQITTLIEMLMTQAVKLDSICTDGHSEIEAQLIVEGKRVQKCVEKLDELKITNARVVKPVVVTTKWETFEDAASSHCKIFN